MNTNTDKATKTLSRHRQLTILSILSFLFFVVPYVGTTNVIIAVIITISIPLLIILTNPHGRITENLARLYIALVFCSILFAHSLSTIGILDFTKSLLILGHAVIPWLVGIRGGRHLIDPEQAQIKLPAYEGLRALGKIATRYFIIASIITLITWALFIAIELQIWAPQSAPWDVISANWIKVIKIAITYLFIAWMAAILGMIYTRPTAEIQKHLTQLLDEIAGKSIRPKNYIIRLSLRLIFFVGLFIIATVIGAAGLSLIGTSYCGNSLTPISFDERIYEAFMLLSNVAIIDKPPNCGAMRWAFIVESSVGLCLLVFGTAMLLHTVTDPTVDSGSPSAKYSNRTSASSASNERA